MLEAGLQQRLAADPAVHTLVATRIYPVVWPSDAPTFPLVTYQLISTVTDQVLQGTINPVTCRVEFDSWSKSYAEVKALAAAVNLSLQDFVGALPEGTHVVNIKLDASTDLFDSPTSSFRVQSDYLVTFNR